MQEPVKIIKAVNDSRPFIISLLQSEKLPVSDLPDPLENFYVAVENEEVIGAIGLEKYDECGLLRSMAVNTKHRNKGIAAKLVNELETQAVKLGITCIYLLTETAPAYFQKKGYETIERTNVPEQIKSSAEFSSVCPVSAIVMKKQIQ